MKNVLRWIILIWSIITIPYALFTELDLYTAFFQLLYTGLVVGLMISDLKEKK